MPPSGCWAVLKDGLDLFCITILLKIINLFIMNETSVQNPWEIISRKRHCANCLVQCLLHSWLGPTAGNLLRHNTSVHIPSYILLSIKQKYKSHKTRFPLNDMTHTNSSYSISLFLKVIYFITLQWVASAVWKLLILVDAKKKK